MEKIRCRSKKVAKRWVRQRIRIILTIQSTVKEGGERKGVKEDGERKGVKEGGQRRGVKEGGERRGVKEGGRSERERKEERMGSPSKWIHRFCV